MDFVKDSTLLYIFYPFNKNKALVYPRLYFLNSFSFT